MAKFIDDTQLFRVLKTKMDCKEFQKDLFKLQGWVLKWHMRFNVSKLMHIEPNNLGFMHRLMGSVLAAINQERDLAVVVDSSVKMLTQCVAAMKRQIRTAR